MNSLEWVHCWNVLGPQHTGNSPLEPAWKLHTDIHHLDRSSLELEDFCSPCMLCGSHCTHHGRSPQLPDWIRKLSFPTNPVNRSRGLWICPASASLFVTVFWFVFPASTSHFSTNLCQHPIQSGWFSPCLEFPCCLSYYFALLRSFSISRNIRAKRANQNA